MLILQHHHTYCSLILIVLLLHPKLLMLHHHIMINIVQLLLPCVHLHRPGILPLPRSILLHPCHSPPLPRDIPQLYRHYYDHYHATVHSLRPSVLLPGVISLMSPYIYCARDALAADSQMSKLISHRFVSILLSSACC